MMALVVKRLQKLRESSQPCNVGFTESLSKGNAGSETRTYAIETTKNDLDAVETTMTMTKGAEGIDTETMNLTRSARSAESAGGKRRRKRKGRNDDGSERSGKGNASENVKEVETDPRMKAKGVDIGHDVKDPFLGNLTDLSGPIDRTGPRLGMSTLIASV